MHTNPTSRKPASPAPTSRESTGIFYFDERMADAGCLCPEENTILFVQAGEFIFRYGAAVYEAGAGQVVFLRKQTLVRYEAVETTGENKGFGFLVFVLKPAVVSAFVRSATLPRMSAASPEMILSHDPGQRLLACISSVCAYFRDGALLTEQLVRIKLLELLHCLAGSRQELLLLQQVLDGREPFRGNINSVVEENIMNTYSLPQLARMAGRSVSSFRRDFHAMYNMPPSRWIRLQRLEKARELLAGTKMTVTSICYTLGFGNIAHFSRTFKAHFGFPPSSLRHNALTLREAGEVYSTR